MREMKDSGIEWIGEIPKDWEITKIGMLYNLRITKVSDTDYAPLSVTKMGVLPQLETVAKTNAHDDRKLVKKGDFVINSRSDRRGSCGISDYYGSVSLINIVLEPKNNMSSGYYSCLFKTVQFADEFYKNGHGIVDDLWTTGWQDMKRIILPVPHYSEQQQIADYLDTKCSEIDATAEDIQKEIDLLEDYKKSVITEAVTKGLNPDAEMKDSGIEWIGDIPKNWVTIRIGNIFSLRNERNYLPMEQVQLLSLYSGKGVFPTGEEGTTNSGNHAQTVADYKIVKRNDIVVNIILAWMGSLGISNYDGVVSPAYDVYIPDEEKVVPHYYHYVFRTSGIANECYRYGRGIMMMRWRTYSSEFKRIHVPFPSFDEQQQIADYLDSKCSAIDTLIADKKRQLDILADYKKSLIYEYVTGKKEVPVNE